MLPAVVLLKAVLLFHCVQLWKYFNSSYLFVKEYPCTPVLPGDTSPHLMRSKCPLSETHPNDACGPVDPAPFDNRSYVAVVPCKNNCSLEEKALNLGQANYVVFITWEGGNCSGSELTCKTSCEMIW